MTAEQPSASRQHTESGSDETPKGGDEWQLVAHPTAQVRLEAIALFASIPIVWSLWFVGVTYLAIVGTMVLAWLCLRMLNRQNYGVWVRAGELDLRGFISARVISSSVISRMVVHGSLAQLHVFSGDAALEAFVGVRGWSDDAQQEVVDRLADWALTEGVEPPEHVSGKRGYLSASMAFLGPVRGSFRHPRRLIRLRPVSIVITVLVTSMSVLVGLAIQGTLAR